MYFYPFLLLFIQVILLRKNIYSSFSYIYFYYKKFELVQIDNIIDKIFENEILFQKRKKCYFLYHNTIKTLQNFSTKKTITHTKISHYSTTKTTIERDF